jgi:hypothetical protein
MRNPLEPQATTSRHRSRLASESDSGTPSSPPSSTPWPLRSSSIKAPRVGAWPLKTPWIGRAFGWDLLAAASTDQRLGYGLLRLGPQDVAAVMSGPEGGILLLGVSLGMRAVLPRGPDRGAQRGADHAAAVEHRRVRRALDLPWRVTPCAVVPLGWPMGRYGPTTRRPVGAVVHLDRYGHQPFKTSTP